MKTSLTFNYMLNHYVKNIVLLSFFAFVYVNFCIFWMKKLLYIFYEHNFLSTTRVSVDWPIRILH